MRRLLTIFACGALFLLPFAQVHAQSTTAPESAEPVEVEIEGSVQALIPDLQVPIPGFSFQQGSVVVGKGIDVNGCEEGYLCIRTIVFYINAIYRYGASIASLFAVVLLMVGGVEYMLGSAAGSIEKAKERMRNAVVGLGLVLGLTAILTFINPAITTLKGIEIAIVDPVAEIALSEGGTPGEVGITREEIDKLGVYCPQKGGTAEVRKIAESFVGKVAYRLGGKGRPTRFNYLNEYAFPWEIGDPRYGTLRNNPRRAPQEDGGQLYANFCPADNICLDCNGFADLVSLCAALPARDPGKSLDHMFSEATSPFITSCNRSGEVEFEDGTEYTLQPGDYVGWGPLRQAARDNAAGTGREAMLTSTGKYVTRHTHGHIMVYVGDGLLIHSTGVGRRRGQGVQTKSLVDACDDYPLFVRRVGT